MIHALIDGRTAQCDEYGPTNRCPCDAFARDGRWNDPGPGHLSHWWLSGRDSIGEVWHWCAGSDEFLRPWVEPPPKGRKP